MRLPWQRRHVFAELEPSTPLPTDVAEDHALIEQAMPFTMTGPARLQATIDAARYCVAAEVPARTSRPRTSCPPSSVAVRIA